MLDRKFKIIFYIALTMAVIGMALSASDVSARRNDIAHKVYLAFGFHVNLFHSFRNDTNDDPIRILKQNYLDVTSSYAIDYFKHSADNLSLNNINIHITAAYVGMVVGGNSLAVGMDTH